MIKKLDLESNLRNLPNSKTRFACAALKINELIDAVNNIVSVQEKLAEISNCSKMEHADTEKHSEPEIPNTAYVTLTEDGCFVGGEPATQYNGKDIYRPYLCVAYFKETRDIIREKYGYELLEIHCLQSSTKGKWAETDNPVPDKDGIYSWVRVVYKNKEDKVASPSWVFNGDNGSASDCAFPCAIYCAFNVQGGSGFRAALFGGVGA